jgi:hypothetical protein
MHRIIGYNCTCHCRKSSPQLTDNGHYAISLIDDKLAIHNKPLSLLFLRAADVINLDHCRRVWRDGLSYSAKHGGSLGEIICLLPSLERPIVT